MQYMCLIYDDEKVWEGMPEDERNSAFTRVRHLHAGDQGQRQPRRGRCAPADLDRNVRPGPQR